MSTSKRSWRVFCSYSHRDEKLRERLEVCLQSLRREGLISIWHDRRITPGQEWAGQIDEHLRRADLVLLLVTSNFIASDYCIDVELKWAMDRYRKGRARIIPIIFRDVFWTNQVFGELQALPNDGKPVMGHPRGTDYALREVAEGIRKVILVNKVHETGYKPARQLSVKHQKSRMQLLSSTSLESLRQAIGCVGIQQKDLAEEAQVSRLWLSQLIAGRTQEVDPTLLSRFAECLADHVKQKMAGREFPDDRGRAVLTFLRQFTRSSKHDIRVYNPGGPVPIDASHYVRRKADDEIEEALRQFPFSLIVTGPVQCGKSSLLVRLENRAESLGIETFSFDPRSVDSIVPTNLQDKDFSGPAALELAERLKARWKLQAPSDILPDSIGSFVEWLRASLQPTKTQPRLLIIDDLAEFGTSQDRWLDVLVRSITSIRAVGGPQLAIAVGRTWQYGSEFTRFQVKVSAVAWWPRIYLSWFTRDEVAEICQHFSSQPDAGQVYRLCGGQPYWAHSMCKDPEFFKTCERWIHSPSELNALAVRANLQFGRHIRALRRSILGPSSIRTSLPKDILSGLLALSDAKISAKANIPREVLAFLVNAHIIDSGLQVKTELYRLVAEALAVPDLMPDVISQIP